MIKQIATIHREQGNDDADQFWIDSNCFWGVDGRGVTVEEAMSNFLTNVVGYCRNYYQLDLWQLDNRVTQLDHVDQILQSVKNGRSISAFFNFQSATNALAS